MFLILLESSSHFSLLLMGYIYSSIIISLNYLFKFPNLYTISSTNRLLFLFKNQLKLLFVHWNYKLTNINRRWRLRALLIGRWYMVMSNFCSILPQLSSTLASLSRVRDSHRYHWEALLVPTMSLCLSINTFLSPNIELSSPIDLTVGGPNVSLTLHAAQQNHIETSTLLFIYLTFLY